MSGEEPNDTGQDPSEDSGNKEGNQDPDEKEPGWIEEADLDELMEYNVEKESLQVVRKESREVLSERIRLLRDLDDKAMRTVRTSVIFIGLVISAIQVSDGSFSSVSTSSLSFQVGVAGVSFLILSIIIGVGTYSASEPDLGVSDGHRTDVVEGEFNEREWLLFQLGEYNEWIRNTRTMTEKNVIGLHLTLFTATAGVISLLLSVVYSMGWKIGPLILPASSVVVISCLVGGILLYIGD
jgi:hypothetical protein